MNHARSEVHHPLGRCLDLIFPEDYALKMLPHQMSRAEVDDVVARVTLEVIEKSWLIGTPEQVAAQLGPWVEEGADYIAPSDPAPALFEPEEQPEVMQTMLEFCSQLRGDSSVPIAG